MSSEAKYDYSYEQFDAGEMPDLFSDSLLDSFIDMSSCNIEESYSAEFQQAPKSYFNDTNIFEQSQEFQTTADAGGSLDFAPLGVPQLFDTNTFIPNNAAASFEGTRGWNLNARDLRSQDDQLLTPDFPSSNSPSWSSEAAQPSPAGSYSTSSVDPSDPQKDVASQAAFLQTRPINCVGNRNLNAAFEIRSTWPQKCPWQGCTSKATFRSHSTLQTHVTNIHAKPLLCTHPGCSYKKPFGKPCDLRRHIATLHNNEREFVCLESDCQEVFARKDKMMKHAREKHGLFKCTRNHCSATVFAAEQELHLRESHDNYECAMGSCEFGKMSYFTEQNLKRHLRTCHRMTYDPVQSAMNPSPRRLGYTKDNAYYAKTGWSSKYFDCPSCSTQSRDEP